MSIRELDPDVREAATTFLLALADDDFVAGHRMSDWITVAPTIEEDNALASIAQDELGHARLWYEYVADATEYDLDGLALNRPADERRNSLLVEPEHGDYADTVAVNYLYDAAEHRLLRALEGGSVDPLADRAAQALDEEPFHREHAELWLERLAATEEGRTRLTRAFEDALSRASDLFAFPDDAIEPLVGAGVLATRPADIHAAWAAEVRSRLVDLPLDVGDDLPDAEEADPETNGRVGEHTAAMSRLIEQMHPDELVGDHPVNRPYP